MTEIGCFPFGCPIEKVIQIDRNPKKVFVLGVYASAVHAKWIGPDDKVAIQALAVRSEPYIFWKGEDAESLISKVTVPEGMGRLEKANHIYNGPSGLALDDHILRPLKLKREDAWLCDLVPHSCMNPGQEAALQKKYLPLSVKYGAPIPIWPSVPKKLVDDDRLSEILDELKESKAEIVILLGRSAD